MAVYDNSHSQSGDHTSRDNAGRDIVYGGVPAAVLDDIREVQLRLIDALDRQGAALRDEMHANNRAMGHRIDRAADEIKLHEIAERQRREADDKERQRRQQEANMYWRLILVWLVILSLVVLAEAWLLRQPGNAAGLVRAVYDLGLLGRRP